MEKNRDLKLKNVQRPIDLETFDNSENSIKEEVKNCKKSQRMENTNVNRPSKYICLMNI